MAITYTYVENQKQQKVLITVGFNDDGDPQEVFCADFKAGTTLHAIVQDACILVSRCLQHGDDPKELVASMCDGPSLIGTVAAAVAECRGPKIRWIDGRGGDASPVSPDNPPPVPSGEMEVA